MKVYSARRTLGSVQLTRANKSSCAKKNQDQGKFMILLKNPPIKQKSFPLYEIATKPFSQEAHHYQINRSRQKNLMISYQKAIKLLIMLLQISISGLFLANLIQNLIQIPKYSLFKSQRNQMRRPETAGLDQIVLRRYFKR